MNKTDSKWTKLIQPDFVKNDNFKSLADSIERASTIVFDDVSKLRNRNWKDKHSYSYGLMGTPTSRRLEKQIAIIENVKHAILFPSGLSAITCFLISFLVSGDKVLFPSNVYGPVIDFANFLKERFGIDYDLYDPINPDNLRISPNTKLVWVETPGSVTMEVSDLYLIARVAHENGALVAVDSTWSAGIALPVFELGADISVQALTKYQSGGSDVLMGSLSTNSDSIYLKLSESIMKLGVGVSQADCHLILRSLPHYPLRYHAQDNSARRIANWLNSSKSIEKVLHPAIPGSIGHNIWKKYFTASASLFSVVFKKDFEQEKIDAFVNALRLFRIGFSWGGAVSLVVPYTKDQLHKNFPFEGSLVRFYIGLEQADDLINDLDQALTKILN